MADVHQYLSLLNEIDETNHNFREEMPNCSLVEYRLMAAANSQPTLRLQDLSSMRWVCQQGVGRIAGALEERGLIRIKVDPTDMRARNVKVTAKGQKMLQKCDQILSKLIAS